VVKYHGLARRYLEPTVLLMRPLLNGGTLGGRNPMPDSFRLMTVGDLKRILADVRDDVSVGIVLPPDVSAHETLTTYLAARLKYTGGPVLSLLPASGDGRPLIVTESFLISNRGVAVLLDQFGEWGLGEDLQVRITSPDGEQTTARASVELIRRSNPNPHERAALLIYGATPASLPPGSTLVVVKPIKSDG